MKKKQHVNGSLCCIANQCYHFLVQLNVQFEIHLRGFSPSIKVKQWVWRRYTHSEGQNNKHWHFQIMPFLFGNVRFELLNPFQEGLFLRTFSYFCGWNVWICAQCFIFTCLPPWSQPALYMAQIYFAPRIPLPNGEKLYFWGDSN